MSCNVTIKGCDYVWLACKGQAEVQERLWLACATQQLDVLQEDEWLQIPLNSFIFSSCIDGNLLTSGSETAKKALNIFRDAPNSSSLFNN